MKSRYMKTYKYAYELPSPNNDRLMKIMKRACKSYGILYNVEECFNYLHKFDVKNEPDQLILPGLDNI